MSDQSKNPLDHDHLIVYGAVVAVMSVIVGLWLFLLPGELDLNSRDSRQAPLWQKLRNDGQATIDNWQESINQVRGSLKELSPREELQAAAVAESIEQEEMDRFRSKLETATVEVEEVENENPNQHDNQEEDTE